MEAHELGAAMLACARAHVDVKERGDHADHAAWWRGGDSPSVRVWPSRAAWRDIVTGEAGGARDYAAMVGLSLRELMQRYSVFTAPVALSRPAAPVKDWWTTARVTATLSQQDHASPLCAEWLASRGWPATHVRLPRATLEWPHRRLGDTTLIEWVADTLTAAGPSLVATLRSARTGQPAALALRHVKPPAGHTKATTVPGCRLADADGAPRGFASPHLALTAPLFVLVEGLPDAMTAAACGLTCAGAVSAGELTARWLPWLRGACGRVVVVPHLGDAGDKDTSKADKTCVCGMRYLHVCPTCGVGLQSSRAVVDGLRAAGVDAALLDWPRLHALSGAYAARDLADVVPVVRDWRALEEMVRGVIG